MQPFRLALISMPWPLGDRPSIQLGTLKSFLALRAPEAVVDCYHAYLEVACLLGIRQYNAIAARTWVAESVYALLLNPARSQEIEALARKEHRAKTKAPPLDLQGISARIARLHHRRHFTLPWSSYQLVGLSICLSQLTASLYFIKELRRRHPGCRIVVGGSSCAGELGRSLLANVPEIDFVISGEGELPLLELIRGLSHGERGAECPGLFWRDHQGQIRGGGCQQLADLSELPPPNYDDYFRLLGRQPGWSNLVPALPVETSRGCWWHRLGENSPGRACRFCNLNLQWQGYRSKEPGQVAVELERLAARHATLRFFLVDNILDPAKIDDLFSAIIGRNRSFEIFTELRATVSRRQLERMRLAGVSQVQIGIEALSSSLLRKISKGTTVIQNIEIMKHCEELGIEHLSNLMLGFPGSDPEDVAQTLDNLKFVSAYQPLRLVRFWLGQNSPVALWPRHYGIRRLANHPYYHLLLPDSLAASLCLMIKSYVGDRTRQQRLWRPVAREVRRWQKEYHSLRRRHPAAPLLGCRDGGDFLLIRRRTGGAEQQTFRLRRSSGAIYRFCRTRQSLSRIRRRFPGFSLEQLQSFVAEMVDKRLMFQEGDQVLSLAVNEDPWRALMAGAEMVRQERLATMKQQAAANRLSRNPRKVREP